MHRIFFLLFLTAFNQMVFSQEKDSSQDSCSPKVFIDCEACDVENLRQDFDFLHYVRDRKLCDVHILVTSRITGSGGTEFTLNFSGRNAFENMSDTIVCILPVNSTSDEKRDLLNSNIQLGLIRYIMKTDLGKHISIRYDDATPANDTIADKWNFWVFKLYGGGWFNGESLVNNTSLNGIISADRVTEEGKTALYASHNYSRNAYQINDSTKIIGLYKNYYFQMRHVWSLSRHWSAGAETWYYSSTYENLEHSLAGELTIEYNIFPYDESSTRMTYFAYGVRPQYRKYATTTLLFRDEQYLISHGLTFNTKFINKWGTVKSEIAWDNYLHDFSLNSLSLYLSTEFRLFKGFSIELSGYYARIRNLINLPLQSASEEEILLRQVQLPTSNQYYCNVGLSYTFGSIYNNIVNPRMQ